MTEQPDMFDEQLKRITELSEPCECGNTEFMHTHQDYVEDGVVVTWFKVMCLECCNLSPRGKTRDDAILAHKQMLIEEQTNE